MKKLNVITGLLLLLFILSYNLSYSVAVDTTLAKKQDVPKEQPNAPKDIKGQSTDKPAKEAPPGNVHTKISETTLQITSILFFVVMLFLFYRFFSHLKNTHQFIGAQSIKLIGLILIFPGVCILALVGRGLLESSTLAALLGTIAGYVLGTEDDSKNASLKDENAKLKTDKDVLNKKIATLNTQIEQLQAQLPEPPGDQI